MTRQIEYDLLKGFGILFVILGHSVPDFPVNLRADIVSSSVEQLMYAFHMSLFFICAGCMVQMAENKPFMTNGGYLIFVKKKFLRLVVPYFCFSVLSLGLKLLFSSFTRSSVDLFSSIYGIVCEGKYFWFLFVMFEVLTTIEFLRLLNFKVVYIWLVAIIFYLLGLALNTNFLCLNRFGYYLIFVLIGMACYKNKSHIDMLLQRWYFVLLIFMIFIGLFQIRGAQSIIVKEICRYALAICGTGLTYSVCLLIKKTQCRFKSVLSYFGKISLPVYLVHMINQLPIYYLVAKMDLPLPIISVVMIFMITAIITYIMVEIMLRIPFLNYTVGMSPRRK